MKVVLRDISIHGKDISLRGPKGSGADFELGGLQLDDGVIDLTERNITLGKLALDAPRATVRRLSSGEINWMQVMRAAPAGDPTSGRFEFHRSICAFVESRGQGNHRRARRSATGGSGSRPERQAARLRHLGLVAQRGGRRQRTRRDSAADALRQRRHAVCQRRGAHQAADFGPAARCAQPRRVGNSPLPRPVSQRDASACRVLGARPRDGRQGIGRSTDRAGVQGWRAPRQPALARCSG